MDFVLEGKGANVGNVTAMVLAGGRGKRMDILCDQRPKPTLSFAGNLHVIDFTLSNCIHSDIKNIAALVDYKQQAMTEYLRQWKAVNKENSLSILPPGDLSYTGTADAVYRNLDYLMRHDSDLVLVLAGDHIYKMDYRRMINFHRESGADVTVGTIRVPMEEACRFGTCIFGPDRRITEFEEKSAHPKSSLASMGIYVFNRDFLVRCLADDARNPASPHDFGYAILPEAVKNARVFAFEFSGYWQDIGTVEAYFNTSMQLIGESPDFRMDNAWPILTHSRSGSLSVQNIGGRVTNSLISPGCIVEGYVENSILSPGVWVAPQSRIINSIVMDNAHIGFQSIVERSILDECVNIGRSCYIGSGSGLEYSANGITMVGKEAVIAPQTTIACRSKILPGSRLEKYSPRLVTPANIATVPA
jgi:glucose-1-phosphate adenylyltransferase